MFEIVQLHISRQYSQLYKITKVKIYISSMHTLWGSPKHHSIIYCLIFFLYLLFSFLNFKTNKDKVISVENIQTLFVEDKLWISIFCYISICLRYRNDKSLYLSFICICEYSVAYLSISFASNQSKVCMIKCLSSNSFISQLQFCLGLTEMSWCLSPRETHSCQLSPKRGSKENLLIMGLVMETKIIIKTTKMPTAIKQVVKFMMSGFVIPLPSGKIPSFIATLSGYLDFTPQ